MTTQPSHFRKTMPAYMAALGMTALIGLCVLAFGLNALLNRNTVPVQAAPENSAASGSSAALQAIPALTGQETPEQLRALIAQYQSRDTQFQTQLQQAADQINQLSQQNQQYQNLITALQNAGVIQITSDGRVLIGRGFRGDDDGVGSGGGN